VFWGVEAEIQWERTLKKGVNIALGVRGITKLREEGILIIAGGKGRGEYGEYSEEVLGSWSAGTDAHLQEWS